MKILSAVIAFFILFGSYAHAEKVYLKDGTVIKGKIVEEGSYYIKVMEGRVPREVFRENIERIAPDSELDPWEPDDIDMSEYEGISVTKVRLILELMDANGTRENLQLNVRDMLNQLQPAQRKQLAGAMDIDGIIAALVPVYDEVYTEEELEHMITFFTSPAGVKMLKSVPDIMKKSIEASSEHFKKSLKL